MLQCLNGPLKQRSLSSPWTAHQVDDEKAGLAKYSPVVFG
jgi:hypothetical protein